MKRILALLLVMILAVFVFGCTSTDSPPAATPTAAATPETTQTVEPQGTPEPEETVTVSMLVPLSGPYASYGLLNEAGFRSYVAAWEEAGGFQNHPNWRLEVNYLDNECNADVSMSLFERYADSTQLFACSISTMSTIACLPLAIKYEIPIMTVGITADRALQEPNDWIFRVTSGDIGNAVTHKMFFEFLEEYSGVHFETYAIICTSDDYGIASSAVFGEKLEELGAVAVMEPEVVPYGQTTSVDGVVSKVKRANPDVIIASCAAYEASLFQKTLKQYQVEIPVMSTGGGYADASFFESVGPGGADGIVSCQTWIYDMYKFCPEPEKSVEWITRSEELTGRGFTEQTVHGWAVMGVALAAIDAAEAPTGLAIRDALLELDLPFEHMFNWYTLFAGCKFGEAKGCYNQNIYGTCIYGQIRDDAYTLVFAPGFEIPREENPLIWPIKPYV